MATYEGMEIVWIEGMYPSFEEAKDMVDAVARGETVDLSKGHTIK